MNTKLVFWLYVKYKLQYQDEMSGDSDKLIPQLKKEASILGIKWDNLYLWKTEEWLRKNVK